MKFDPLFLKKMSTPLHEASKLGDVESVRRLLKEPNPDVYRLDGCEMDPLTWAAKGGHDQVLDLLLEHRDLLQADEDVKSGSAMVRGTATRSRTLVVSGSHPLLAAASRNQLSTVQKLVDRGEDLNVVEGTMGHSGLHMAANRGHLDVVKLMLESKVNPDGTDYRGYTPLSVACFCGRLSVVELLLKSRAEPNVMIQDEPHGPYTPLSLACRKGKDDVIEMLLQHSAVPDKRCLEYVTSWDEPDEELVARLRSKLKAAMASPAPFMIRKAEPSRAGGRQSQA